MLVVPKIIIIFVPKLKLYQYENYVTPCLAPCDAKNL